MKAHRLIIFFVLNYSVQINAQTATWKWGNSHCVLTSSDSAFLVNTEKAMWQYEKTTNSFTLFEGFHGSSGYHVRISKVGMEAVFADTNVAKVQFTNIAELLTVWTPQADSFWIIGFEPMISIKRNTLYRSPQVWLDTTCYVHIPLYNYHNFLEQWKMKKMHEILLNCLSEEFGAIRIGDTLYRSIDFQDDSNLYLPQASYIHMGEMMKNGMLAGQLAAYKQRHLDQPMFKRQLEESFTYWDSTNAVEDPNHPGVFILAPIKVEERPVGIVVYEKWIPEISPEETSKPYPNYRPQPYLKYTRQVISYGLKLTSGSILWASPVQFDKLFQLPKFNFTPYEESFRAERFETMHIALET